MDIKKLFKSLDSLSLEERKELKGYLLKNVYCSIDPLNVFTHNKAGLLMCNGEQLTEAEISSLQEEIKFLTKTRIWGILTNTLKDMARQTMCENSQTWDDMLTGKMMLFNISIQENVLKLIQDYKKRLP